MARLNNKTRSCINTPEEDKNFRVELESGASSSYNDSLEGLTQHARGGMGGTTSPLVQSREGVVGRRTSPTNVQSAPRAADGELKPRREYF